MPLPAAYCCCRRRRKCFVARQFIHSRVMMIFGAPYSASDARARHTKRPEKKNETHRERKKTKRKNDENEQTI